MSRRKLVALHGVSVIKFPNAPQTVLSRLAYIKCSHCRTALEVFLNVQFPSNPEWFSEPQWGVVDEAIALTQDGRIKFQGTYWTAKLYRPGPQTIIQPGQQALIVALQDLTLLVIPSS